MTRPNERLVLDMAALARLRLSEREAGSIARHLARVLEWLEILDEVDTREVEPTSHPLVRTCPRRPDGEPISDCPAAAPGGGGRFLVVPGTAGKKG